MKIESHGGGGTCREGNVLRLLEKHGIGLRIEEPDHGLTRKRLFAGVDDTGRDGTLITLTDKAGHVGLYHHILLGHGLTGE